MKKPAPQSSRLDKPPRLAHKSSCAASAPAGEKASFSEEEIASAFDRFLCGPDRPAWKLVINENVLDQLRAMGFPWMVSKTISSAPMSFLWSRDGDCLTFTPSLGGVLKVAPQKWTLGENSDAMDAVLGKYYVRSKITIVDGKPQIVDAFYTTNAERKAAGAPRGTVVFDLDYSNDGTFEIFTQTIKYDFVLPKPARGNSKMVCQRPSP